MLDFNQEYDLPPSEFNDDGVASPAFINKTDAVEPKTVETRVEEHVVYVRGVLYNSTNKKFLAQVNNRLSLGSLTIMLPGGLVNGKSSVEALRVFLQNQIGITMPLDQTNCRFIQSRTYEMTGDNGKYIARVDYFAIDAAGAVPYNMMPDNVLSLSWLSVTDVERYLNLDSTNWKIQVGIMDAIQATLDPDKSRIVDSTREITRQDGGNAPDKDQNFNKPSALAYSA